MVALMALTWWYKLEAVAAHLKIRRIVYEKHRRKSPTSSLWNASSNLYRASGKLPTCFHLLNIKKHLYIITLLYHISENEC